MKKLMKYLKPYKLHLILGPAFKLLEAVFELIVPLVMADIIDNGINGGGGVNYVLWRGLILLGLAIVGLICSMTCQYFASRCSQGYGTVLRNDLFRHINSLSYAELDKIGTPSMINRMNGDINQLQLAVAMLIRLVVRAPFLVIGAAIMAMTINLKLSLIFLVVAPLLSLVLYMIMSKTIPLYTKLQKKLDNVSLITRENLSGVRVVRAFAKQDKEKIKFDNASEELCYTAKKVGIISALLNPLTFLIINIAVVAILYFGGRMVNTGSMTQGEVVAFVNYLMQISLALTVVANLVIMYTKAFASAKRVREILDTEPSITDKGNDIIIGDDNAPVISFRNVSFGYNNGGNAISGISFDALKGETIGIIGGTGSGKSTIINLIPRLYDVTDGEILINGVNVKKYTFKELKRKIGIVPQKSVLFSGTILSNMRWRNENATEEEIWKALEIAQADEFVKAKEKSLDEYVNQGGKNFSGGQRQRLAIARALVDSPEILIMDDSTSALDFATEAKLLKSIKNDLDKNIVKLLISQRTGSIMNADKILVMDKGECVGYGTHKELMKDCEVYKEIYASQNQVTEVAV